MRGREGGRRHNTANKQNTGMRGKKGIMIAKWRREGEGRHNNNWKWRKGERGEEEGW
jgi:hypothetical protein